MGTRHVLIRARNPSQARKFAKSVCKMSTVNYSPERVTSVALNKTPGFDKGLPAYTVGLTKRKVERYKTGKKKGMLRPKR